MLNVLDERFSHRFIVESVGFIITTAGIGDDMGSMNTSSVREELDRLKS